VCYENILFNSTIVFGCSGQKKTEDKDLYFNAEQYKTYDSSTGKTYNGVGTCNGPDGRKVENTYKNGNAVETNYTDKDGSTANFKYDADGNKTGQTFKDPSGNVITEQQFDEKSYNNK
jgi:YD repeat-containing protein